ncbi:MAG: SBBP repeat-containing protein [Candidatus Xenobiia bacterium LiM19]
MTRLFVVTLSVFLLLAFVFAAGGCSIISGEISSHPSPGEAPIPSPSPTLPAAYHLAFLNQPIDTVAGSRMSPGIRIEVLDSGQDRVITSQVTVTINITPGSGSLGGQLTVQAVDGVAKFDNLVPLYAGKDYALVASSPEMTEVTSNMFHVTEPPAVLKSIEIEPSTVTTAAGHNVDLKATGIYSDGYCLDITGRVTWASSNPAIVSAGITGIVTGLHQGSASITAALEGVTGTAYITVTAAALKNITVTPSQDTASVGMQKTFEATGTFSDGTTQVITTSVDWSSSDEKVGVIKSKGVVNAVEAGTTTISASDVKEVKGTAIFTVTSAPTVAPLFSTYLGGKTAFQKGSSPFTFAQNTAADNGGCTYVTGGTSVSDLPLVRASQSRPASGSTLSCFVAKYGINGDMLWCTYLGGNRQTMGTGIGVLPDGSVAVCGWTSSTDFPVKNAYQSKPGGQIDAFLTVYDSAGTIRYSTYLGGAGIEGPGDTAFADDSSNGNNLAVDSRGLVYITGETDSTDFPVTANANQKSLSLPSPPPSTLPSDSYIAICNLSEQGTSSIIYSSYLGGTDQEKGHAITVDPAGTLITSVGYTSSRNFPATSNAFRDKPPKESFTSNGYVAQFMCDAPGEHKAKYMPRYVTYLGAESGEIRDDAYAVTLAANGTIVVTGRTQSAGFPVTSETALFGSAPYLVPHTSGDEPYIARLDPSLSGTASLVYGTFMGGGDPGVGGTFATGIAVDEEGATYIGGEVMNKGSLYTPSPPPAIAPELFPYTADAFMNTLRGAANCMLMRLSADGRTLSYSTFLGGSVDDRTYGLAVDSSGNVHWTGVTRSADFPLRKQAQPYPGNKGHNNAFILKFGTFGSQ